MKIVVIGGSGLIGSKLVATLRDNGHDTVPAAPDTGVDTVTGEGLDDVLVGASVVVDVSNAPSYEEAAVLEFFETSTRNLLEAEIAASVGHHVALSIVGTNRLPDSSYYSAKLVQERLIESSSVPYSIVHSTQFFEFIDRIAQAAIDGDTVRVAPVLVQPIAAADVASALARVAVDAPLNGVIEIAGPEQFRLDELIQRVLGTRHERFDVVADPEARYFGGKLGPRTLVPAQNARLGPVRFEEWLDDMRAARR